MPIKVIFYCNYISANIGVPGVNQALLADLVKCYGSNSEIYGSDYQSFYKFSWSDDMSSIDVEKVAELDVDMPSMVVFSGFDPYRWTLPKILKWKMKGCHVGFWTWGYHTKQQCEGNWENGKIPNWLKKIATNIKKHTLAPLIDYYLVSGNFEIIDSGLNPAKCIKMPMGRPQSKILDACDKAQGTQVDYGCESVNYIGRGRWYAKGIDNIVKYASSRIGTTTTFRLYISSMEEGFEEKAQSCKSDNVEWYYDTFGSDNLIWLQKCKAFITVNKNPTMIRATYESLYSGTPIVVLREAYMDGFKELLDIVGLSGSILILGDEELTDCSFTIPVMDSECRSKLAESMQILLDSSEFSQWFGSWLKAPSAPVSYYDHISKRLLLSDDEE